MTENKLFAARQSDEALGADDVNPYAAPQSSEQHPPREAQVGEGPWRDGRLLVMLKETALPPRCVNCNAPTEFFLRGSLSWHHPLLYVLVPFTLLYIIVALIVRRKAKVNVGLCDRHRRNRLIAIAIGWIIWSAGVLLIVVGVADDLKGENANSIIVGLAAYVGGLIFVLLGARTVVSKRIDDQHVWLKGVCPEFLVGLPDWMAPERAG